MGNRGAPIPPGPPQTWAPWNGPRPQPPTAPSPFGAPGRYGPPQQYGAPGQFGAPPPFGGQSPLPYAQPPRKSRTGLIIGLITLVAVVGAGVGVLVWQPWKSTDSSGGPHTETAMLDDNVSLTVELPADWRLETGTIKGKVAAMAIPDTDTRTVAQIDSDGSALANGGNGRQVHAVIAQAGPCSESAATVAVGRWSQDSDDQSSHGQADRSGATTRIDDSRCVRVVGVDFAHSTDALTSEASELLPKLIANDKITAARAV